MQSINTEQLLERLDDPQEEVRIMAVKYLGMRYDKRSIEPLIKLLNDNNLKIREQAIYSLGAIGDVDIILDPILHSLKEKILPIQIAAIKVLGETGSTKATKPLIKLLTHKDRRIRESSVIALGQIQDKNALFPLIDMLNDKDIGIKINSIIALGNLNDNRAIEPLIEKLDDEKSVVKMATITLSKFKEESIIEPLIKILNSEDPKIRQCAVYSLGTIGNPKIIDPMLKLLNDNDILVRQATAAALSNIKDEKIIQEFLKKMNDDNEEVRQSAARAIGKMGDETSVEHLIKNLKDKSPLVRIEILNSLGELGDVDSINSISKYLKDKNKEVRAAAASSIGKISSYIENVSTIKDLFGNFKITYSLKRALKDKESIVRIQVAEALAKIYLSQINFSKSRDYYYFASEESLSWDFRQGFYEACAIGCQILEDIKNDNYIEQSKNFNEIYDLLQGAGKMFGVDNFVSEIFWNLVKLFNEIMRTTSKKNFTKLFKDLGMNLLLLTKKLPERLRIIVDEPQIEINQKYQVIEKKGLTLEESLEELKSLKFGLFKLISKILQIEPLKIEEDKNDIQTLEILENITFDGLSEQFSEQEDTTQMITKMIKPKDSSKNLTEKNFILKKAQFMLDYTLPDTIQWSLIQIHKGARKLTLVEEDRILWERFIKRYYHFKKFQEERIYEFTHDSVIMRVKPKIIGFMDDAIYEGSSIIIFPELSVPHSYLEKLQGYADHYDLFIIAGIESIKEKNVNYNRVYIIGPKSDKMEFQQKNSRMIVPGTELKSDWIENNQITNPPEIKIFETCIGRFMILIGSDYYKLNDYIPFICRENQLDFVLVAHTGIFNKNTDASLEKISKITKIPFIFVNTGQFGGTNIYYNQKDNEIENADYLKKPFSDGIVNWNFQLPKWIKKLK